MTIINESGLYSLVLSSKLDSAKRFKRWINSVIGLLKIEESKNVGIVNRLKIEAIKIFAESRFGLSDQSKSGLNVLSKTTAQN